MKTYPPFVAKTGDDFSTYRTRHQVANYAEFTSVAEFATYIAHARSAGLAPYVLGKGSNTFFAARNIKAAVLKNQLPEIFEVVSDTPAGMTMEISSTVSLMKVLRFCQQHGLESFYYLASAPGNIGGALAMNAGGAINPPLAIYDFVDTVTCWEAGVLKTMAASAIPRSYRTTPFTGVHDKLIISARFTFPKIHLEDDPIQKRLEWYRLEQDTSGPSCGSVFHTCNGYLMGALKRTQFKIGGSHFSGKWANWIVCQKGSHRGIAALVLLAQSLHWLLGKKAILEIVRVK